MTEYNISKLYNQYADDVLNKRITACEDVILACKRYKSWFKRDDIYFDYEDVDARIKLVSKMKHWKGKANGKPFILLPYQQWIFANLFGWKYKETELRVIKKALLFVARKAGKTALSAAIALTQLILDKNNGQDIGCVANSGQQARILFDMVKNFAESMDPQSLLFQRYRDTIRMPSTKSVVKVLNSDAMTQDGEGFALFIEDEFAAAKTWDIWNVLISGQGFQTQPLAIAITSANYLLDGFPCFEWVKTCKEILRGTKTDDSTFCALYSLDEKDDWMNDESCWIKANPSLGVTTTYEYLRDQVTTAKNQTAQEMGVKTKNFNIFCQSVETWIPANYIRSCMEAVNLDDYKGELCYGAADLSAVSDLTCTTVMFPPNESRKLNPDKYVFKTFIYLPESALDESINKMTYKNWVRNKEAILTEGNVVDYSHILKDQIEIMEKTPFSLFCYDQWNATQWAIEATQAGIPLEAYSQAVGNFNRPTKFLEILIRSGKCIIDKSTAVLWCFNNVRLRTDYNDNVKADKNTREQKIDPVISMTMALGGYLMEGGADVEMVV